MALTDNILAYWKLDEEYGLRVDSTGNGYDLSEYSTVYLDGNGAINDAAYFDGTSSYLSYYDYANDLAIPINYNNFSVAGWLKLASSNNIQPIIAQWNQNIQLSWILIYENEDPSYGSGLVLVTNGGQYHITTNIIFNIGEWYHFAMTYDGTIAKLYFNGQLVGQANVTIISTTQPLTVGQADGQFFNGSLDEIGIWNRALTPENVFNLYYRRIGNSYPFSKPLIQQTLNDELLAHWPLDENIGTRYDYANGYNLSQNGIVGNDNGIIKGTLKNINDGLQAYWKLNETNGTRYDSINGLQLTETGGSVDSSSGLISNAVQFTNGDQAWLTFPAGICDISDDGHGQKTYSIWFKINQNYVGYQWIWCQGTGHDYSDVMPCYIESNGTISSLFEIKGTGGWAGGVLGGDSYIVPSTGEWHHVVNTFDGKNACFYYDGDLIKTVSYSGGIISSGSSYTLGHYNAYPDVTGLGGTPFDGAVDEIGLWDRALSSGEVRALYNDRIGKTYPLPIIKNSLAASFNGLPQNTLLNDNIFVWNNWSFSFWCNIKSDVSDYAPSPNILNIGNITGDRIVPYFVPVDSNNYVLGLYDQNYDYNVQNNFDLIKYGTWKHIVITSNFINGLSFYVDGVLKQTNSNTTISRNWIGLALGNSGITGGYGYEIDGLIDDVKVWNRSLNSDEVLSIYKSGSKTSKYNFQKVLGIPTFTFDKLTPQTILNLPFYFKTGTGGSLTIPLYQNGLYGKRYNGYYIDNGGVNIFGTAISRSTDTNSIHGDEEATVDFNGFSSSDEQNYDYYSWQWLGYFKAPYTDDYVFSIQADDIGSFWIGDNAVSGFTWTNATVHSEYGGGGQYYNSAPIHLIGGQYYPVRLQFGEVNGEDFINFKYSSTYETDVTNFQGRFFHKTTQDFIENY